jgi:hypothetical protein
VHALGVGLRVQTENLRQSRGRRGLGSLRLDWTTNLAGSLGHCRSGHQHRVDQLPGRHGLGHRRIRPLDAEPLLDADQDLDAFQATEATITVERVVQGDRPPPLQSAKLVDERPNDLEDASLNRLRCGVRSGYRGRHAPSLIALSVSRPCSRCAPVSRTA